MRDAFLWFLLALSVVVLAGAGWFAWWTFRAAADTDADTGCLLLFVAAAVCLGVIWFAAVLIMTVAHSVGVDMTQLNLGR